MADLKPLWAKDPLVAHSTSSGMGDHAALESLEPLLITYLQLLCKLTCAASCTACLRDLASGTTRSSPVCLSVCPTDARCPHRPFHTREAVAKTFQLFHLQVFFAVSAARCVALL